MHGGRGGITGGVDVDLRTTCAVRPRTKGCTPHMILLHFLKEYHTITCVSLRRSCLLS